MRPTPTAAAAQRPAKVETLPRPAVEKVLFVACGLEFIAVHVRPRGPPVAASSTACSTDGGSAASGGGGDGIEDLSALSVRDLKKRIASAGLATHDCLDKADLVERAREASQHAAAPTATPEGGDCQVYTRGRFCRERQHELRPWAALSGLPLRQLAAGGFHCCCVTTTGDIYTWGHQFGDDHANGNLLGHGERHAAANGPTPPDGFEIIEGMEEGVGAYGVAHGVRLPRRVASVGLGAVAEIACSTYSTLAITVDGRALSWGDCDGDALGHTNRECDAPFRVAGLAGLLVAHGDVCYTNGAVALKDGSVFVWGGGMWEGGLGSGQEGPSRVAWGGGVPPCYRCAAVQLGHRHGYLIFRKEP